MQSSGGPLDNQLEVRTAGRNKSFTSLVFILTQLHFGQWSSLPFCLPSLIVQWPISYPEPSIFLLRMLDGRVRQQRVWVRDCPVARQSFSLVATAHDCETGLLRKCGFFRAISKLMLIEHSRLYETCILLLVYPLFSPLVLLSRGIVIRFSQDESILTSV